MKKKRIKFFEGGDIPNIPREPLRDSSGDIVRDSSGEAIMSGSTKERTKSGPKGYLDDDIKLPSKKEDDDTDQHIRPRPPPPALIKTKTEDTDEADRRREEIGKLPQKTRGKPKSTNASEAPGSTDVERPYGAFRGNRSDTETDADKRSRGAFRGIRNDSAKDAENKKRGAFRGTRSDSASEMNKRGAFRGTRSDMSQDYFAKGGKVGSASKRADGIAQRGKTRGMMR